jgi:HEAT repeat protein
LVNPAPLPKPAEAALLETSTPDSDVFAKVPWTGVLPSGVWSLPANADEVILRLANNRNNEIRWRAVQGLSSSFQPGKRLAAERVVPILIVRLGDDYNRIRNAASFALADQGERALDIEPKLASILTAALKPHRSKIWEDEFGGLDTDASNGGHAARLLATISARLTPKQRKDAIAAIERAAKRLDGPNSEYIHFHSMGIQAATFMREQAKRLVEPPKWTLPELWGVYAFPNREDRRLSMHECDRRLAEAYSTEPAKTIAAAIQVLTDGGDRSATIGAANWLMSTGPAAVPALDALDSMQSRKDDPYVQQQAQSAAKYIRESVQTPALTAHAVPHDVRSQLDSPDPFVRAAGAELAAQSRDASAIVPALERLLIDDEFVEVGIEGRFECEGRLFHWRRERRSPRASAIDALFAIDRLPSGDAMLTAMLAVAKLTRVICGATTIPHRFTIAQWRQAVDAAGGHAVADSRIRTARQQCRANEWLGHNGPMNCAAELAEVIRQLSGRLVPNR